jgi:hypothetical protein
VQVIACGYQCNGILISANIVKKGELRSAYYFPTNCYGYAKTWYFYRTDDPVAYAKNKADKEYQCLVDTLHEEALLLSSKARNAGVSVTEHLRLHAAGVINWEPGKVYGCKTMPNGAIEYRRNGQKFELRHGIADAPNDVVRAMLDEHTADRIIRERRERMESFRFNQSHPRSPLLCPRMFKADYERRERQEMQDDWD